MKDNDNGNLMTVATKQVHSQIFVDLKHSQIFVDLKQVK